MPDSSNKEIVEWASRLRAAVGPLERQLRQTTPSPYTPTQMSILGAIYRYGPIALSELAKRERLSLPTVSKAVGSLHEAGVVERTADDDRRVWLATLSDAGLSWIEESRARRNEWLAERIATLSAPERAALAVAVPVLERLLEAEL